MAVISSYKDSSGLCHWPDAPLNSEKYYAVDWTDYLDNEVDTIGIVTWTVPSGLTNMDSNEVGDQARIKLRADTIGNYEVVCTMTSTEGAETQKHVQVMHIEVV